MEQKTRVILGEDGKYRIANSTDELESDGFSARKSSESSECNQPRNGSETRRDQAPAPVTLTSVSPSSTGACINDDVAAKRANLVNAKGQPYKGRRESPEPYDPRPKRIMYVKGILAGLVVVVIACCMVVFLGGNSNLG